MRGKATEIVERKKAEEAKSDGLVLNKSKVICRELKA